MYIILHQYETVSVTMHTDHDKLKLSYIYIIIKHLRRRYDIVMTQGTLHNHDVVSLRNLSSVSVKALLLRRLYSAITGTQRNWPAGDL